MILLQSCFAYVLAVFALLKEQCVNSAIADSEESEGKKLPAKQKPKVKKESKASKPPAQKSKVNEEVPWTG